MHSEAAPATAVRVLVVDDSACARGLIRALIEEAPGLTVCGEAENGRQAVEQVLALRPDIVTLDLQMPVMDGMAAIEEIMALRATPILVLSDLADARNAMAAVARGALEAAHKPGVDDGSAFTARLKLLARVPVIRHIRRKPPAAPNDSPPVAKPVTGTGRVFAIAASTGGPQALAQLLPCLPANFPAPVLVVQHIADGFAAGMAAWLNDLCPLPVALARDGESLVAGRIYLADSTTHLAVTAGPRLQLRPRAAKDIYRPSCDVMLCSAAEIFGRLTVGVILTGMGRDGVRGMVAIRQAGGATLAQDEATSVVYGMNREAITAGGVQWVLPLTEIASRINGLAHAPVLAS